MYLVSVAVCASIIHGVQFVAVFGPTWCKAKTQENTLSKCLTKVSVVAKVASYVLVTQHTDTKIAASN